MVNPQTIKQFWQFDPDQQKKMRQRLGLITPLAPIYRCPVCDRKLKGQALSRGVWLCKECKRNYAEIELKE